MRSFDKIPENPFILAPMAGITDGPMRLLSRRHGAGLVCMEMVSANAIKYGNKKTEELLRIHEDEHPVSLQLFGPDPDTIALAAKYVSKYDYDILDINMGCPMPKIVKNGEGSALMRDLDLAGRIVEAAVKAQDRPVSVKIRSGYSRSEINAVEVAKAAEEAGACAVAVHGRTREQLYEGKADWDIIKAVTEELKIPVIGNGDILSAADALRMMNYTGCRYVMIGRASRGNPWIFGECLSLYKDGIMPPRPSVADIKKTVYEHIDMQIEEKGEYLGVREMRKHISWYMTGLKNAAHIRRKVNSAVSKEELVNAVEMYLEEEAGQEPGAEMPWQEAGAEMPEN